MINSQTHRHSLLTWQKAMITFIPFDSLVYTSLSTQYVVSLELGTEIRQWAEQIPSSLGTYVPYWETDNEVMSTMKKNKGRRGNTE